MSEIEKMYENAGIKKINTHQSEIDNGDPRFTGISHSDSYIKYPPFTAEKQIELIKWLGTTEYYTFGIFYRQGLWYIFTETTNRHNENFDECLAKLINDIWQDLSEEEKQQVKGILE